MSYNSILDQFNTCVTTSEFLQFSHNNNILDRDSAYSFLCEHKDIPFVIRNCTYSRPNNHVYCITEYDYDLNRFRNIIIQAFLEKNFCLTFRDENSQRFKHNQLSDMFSSEIFIGCSRDVRYYSNMKKK